MVEKKNEENRRNCFTPSKVC